MHLVICGPDFPQNIIRNINEASGLFDQIVIHFREDSNQIFSQQALVKLMEAISKHSRPDVKIEITPGSIPLLQLQPSVVEILLSNSDFLSQLANHSFLELVVSSEDVANFVLSQPSLVHKLNNVEKALYDRAFNTETEFAPQTFESSCGACVIMMALRERNLLKREECTRSKELEIYKEIWFAPNQIEDPEKMIAYCLKNKLPVAAFQMTEITKRILAKNESLNSQFDFFKKKFTRPLTEIDSEHGLKEFIKSNESAFLVNVVVNIDNSHVFHITFVKRNDENQLEIIDPADGTKQIYNSFEEYCAKTPGFMGVAFVVSENNPGTSGTSEL